MMRAMNPLNFMHIKETLFQNGLAFWGHYGARWPCLCTTLVNGFTLQKKCRGFNFEIS